jgi:electron transport complex protein RnfB
MDNKKNKKINRRDFINNTVRLGIAVTIGGIGVAITGKTVNGETVWQLDPTKCVQCGRCATNCVLALSAVKCFHVYNMCGYCDLCGGYFRPNTKELTTAAENQLCPTSALTRHFIEEPFFEYHIDEDLCNGCGKCVKGCAAFGNGSLQLQANHKLCVNCNHCSIARDCPAEAWQRVPAEEPYMLSGFDNKKK